MKFFGRERKPRRSMAEMYADLQPQECANPNHSVYKWSDEKQDFVCVDCGHRMPMTVKQRYEDAGNDLFDF